MLIELNTPSMLFPAISLLMLAYTNRYLALASLIRKLHSDYVAGHEPEVRAQIENLRDRMRLIRQMQICGLVSLLLCLCSIIAFLLQSPPIGTILFGLAVGAMTLSIIQCLREVLKSGGALDILLKQLERAEDRQANATRSDVL